jgi:hypothetical protein
MCSAHVPLWSQTVDELGQFFTNQMGNGRCQTDANSSQFIGNGNLLGRQKTAPLCESGSTVQLEDGS